jgi:hypothetical protein
MSREPWQKLVVKYADGRPICNCRDAYYTPCGVGYVGSEKRTDMLVCEYGCSANQIRAKEEIADKIISEQLGGRG